MNATNSSSPTSNILKVTPSHPISTGAIPVVPPAESELQDAVAHRPTSERLDRDDFLLLAVMVIAAFILILNETLLGVALPMLMENLHIPATTAQWSSTGFMLTMAVVTPASGFIISRFSIRTVFVGAMTVFSAGRSWQVLPPHF